MATNIPVIKESSSDPTVGSVLYWNGHHYVPLAPGSSGQALVSSGAAAAPAYTTQGDYVSSVIPTASAVGSAFTNDDFGNVTSIEITAGDWDVTGVVNVQAGTFTVTGAAVSIHSGTTNTDHVLGSNVVAHTQTNTTHTLTVPTYRLNVEATTTVYLKARLSGTEADLFSGRLSARRTR